MKKLLLVTSVLLIGLTSCSDTKSSNSNYPQERNNVTVQPLSNDVSIQADANNAAFDVAKLAELAKKSTNPKLLEQEINNPANNVNNLDLNNDGKVDYLQVVEKGNNQLQIVDIGTESQPVIATLNISQNNGQAVMNIQGSPQYSGSGHSHHSSFDAGDMLLMAYLMRPHALYAPAYHYGSYPPSYQPRTVTRTTTTRTVNRTPTTTSSASASASSVKTTPSTPQRTSVTAPSSSQRSFEVRNTSQPVRTGGFGSKPSTTSTPSAAAPRSSYSSNRSGFGSGSSSSSSSSSYRSSSSSSRSGFGSSRSSGFGSSSSRSSGSSRRR